MYNKPTKKNTFSPSKEMLLSQAIHSFLDDKLTNVIYVNYKNFAMDIEIKTAKLELKKNFHRLETEIDKLLYLKQLIRQANERANIILGTKNFEFGKDFRDILASSLSITASALEETICLIIKTAFEHELLNVKYQISEQVYAAGQYFKERSNNLGLLPNYIASVIDKIIERKILTLKSQSDSISILKPGEAGKIIISGLRQQNPISKEIIEKTIKKIEQDNKNMKMNPVKMHNLT
jgi:hypothetical protein